MLEAVRREHVKNYILIFSVNAITMITELVASRILSPYFGVTNDVWTIVIGMILLSGSVGNVIGGKTQRIKKIYILLALAVTTAVVPYIAETVLVLSRAMIKSFRIGAMVSACILFFIPSALSGMLTPMLLSENTERLDEIGEVSGVYYAVMTIGGLFGTFAGGFWLIPVIGSSDILKVMGVLCILLAVIAAEKRLEIIRTCLIGIAMIAIMLTTSSKGHDKSVIYETDSEYAHIVVWEGLDSNGEPSRFMQTGEQNAYMSGTYLAEDKRYDIHAGYLRVMANLIPDGNANILLCGGGGYDLPKWFLANEGMKDSTLDVVELDAGVVKAAERYFYLSEAVNLFDPEQKRFHNYINDGRLFIENKENAYDIIMNDAFAGGGVPARTLTTKEFCEEVYDALTENGRYVVNVIGALEGKHSKFLQSEYKTIESVFGNAAILKVSNVPDDQRQNYIIVASKKAGKIENAVSYKPGEDAFILTDDYSPVDTLFAP